MKDLYFEDSIKPSSQHIKFAKTKCKLYKKVFWDPTNSFDLKNIYDNNIDLYSRDEYLKENKDYKNKQKVNAALFGGAGTLFSILIFVLTNYSPFPLILGLIISWIYAVYINKKYDEISIDIKNSEIAISNNWNYDPYHDNKKFDLLLKHFPEIFNKGNTNQYVENQFWGSFSYNSKRIGSFYCGTFFYTHEKGIGVSKSYKNHVLPYFIIKSPKKIEVRFQLYPINAVIKATDCLEKNINEILIDEFKKNYTVVFYPKTNENIFYVKNILSHKVQEKLSLLASLTDRPHVLFTENAILFCFNENYSFSNKFQNNNNIKENNSKNNITFLIKHAKSILENL